MPGINNLKADLEQLDLEEKIRKENRQLKEEIICKICRDTKVDRLFLPCGHLATCHFCSPALVKCPICRQNIKGIVSVYM